MTTQAPKPDTAPQEGNYPVLRQRVADTVRTMHPGNPGEQSLAGPELYDVIRVASQGVLRQLQEQGIKEAGTLAIRLEEAARHDDSADLPVTVSGRFADAQGMRESGVDTNAQAQQQRMALLASAAGETATAIVGSVLNPGNLTPLVKSGRDAVFEYKNAVYKTAGADLLTGLLEQAEAAADQPKTARAA